MNHSILSTVFAGVALAGAATAQGPQAEILVTSDIAVSTTWTADNVYNLQQQIYVLPGATLTIQAGTRIASTTDLGGSLAVAKGAQIFIQGTKDAPVVMTSKADNGTWREAANEWGNLTIMGAGHIASCRNPSNVPTCAAGNTVIMEGLTRGAATDSYGGGNDDDDSGSIGYLSIRFGGKVIGLGNELNGLSLGGIGRETDIHHVEIMNNVDDGIEVWGGTVNLEYFSIWNVGDDSFDVDQGWRGKAQFGLIVQGYSVDAPQGSGVGDNAIEVDGAEGSDWQPVTTTTLYNLTVIGQPVDGDGLTAWRDNARVQYRNSIFMDGGEKVVRFDDLGDHSCGGLGYGFNSTLTWAQTWTTDWNMVPPHANDCPPGTYTAQSSGKLAEMKDSVFFNNADYTDADAVNVFAAGNNNVREPANSPITAITRGAQVAKGGKILEPVTFLDPRPANDALNSVAFAAGDSFFAPVKYRGAFAPGNNWLRGWTASEEFGLTQKDQWCDLGKAGPAGAGGLMTLAGEGPLTGGSATTLRLRHGPSNSGGVLMIGASQVNFPLFFGILCPSPDLALATPPFNSAGSVDIPFGWPNGISAGSQFYLQIIALDGSVLPANFSFSNALRATAQ